MRQCIFVVGTRPELVSIAPVLQAAAQSGLRHTVWFTGENRDPIDDVVRDFALKSIFVLPKDPVERSGIGKRLRWLPSTLWFSSTLWFPSTIYRCFHYINGVKLWTSKRPLVIVHGDTLSTLLGAVAGHWAGGDIVNLESGSSSGKRVGPFPQSVWRRMIHKRTRYAFCPDEAAAARMRRYPGCIVEVGPSPVNRLLRWAGANEKNASA
ncbi:MAG: UDP-N-acetylglucosamine 2-epimerase [Gammaproteobacteria bacterium]|nr:UDP-N-acetylglucosamine 2-epimerase [Gammaproteobacteria bacterium]NNL51651.1 hypothetical protein [Woeseiaceae bacterium]